MILTTVQMTDLIRKVEDARRAATGPGVGLYCQVPHAGPDGNPWRWEPKPHARASVGRTYPDGTQVEYGPDGAKGIKVPLGVHGRGHLGIDPASGEVVCALCDVNKEASRGA